MPVFFLGISDCVFICENSDREQRLVRSLRLQRHSVKLSTGSYLPATFLADRIFMGGEAFFGDFKMPDFEFETNYHNT